MSIVTEIEKLASLRESGALSQAEFDKAKERLLSEDRAGAASSGHAALHAPAGAGNASEKVRSKWLAAILMTVATVLSVITAVLSPSTLKVIAASLFALSAVLSWASYAKLRKLGSA